MGNDNHKVTPMQRAFALEFPKDFNRTKAAIRAGYSPASAHISGHRNIKNAKVWALIEKEFTKRAMSLDEVLVRLTAQARGELATTEINSPQGQTARYEARAALELLGKYHKLFVDRLEITDWREDARKAGFEPSEIFEEMVKRAVEAQMEEVE